MPVVNFTIKRLNKLLPGIHLDKVLQTLPFIGLDIEGVDNEVLRIEYNPNRPDFASDYGIVRALRGLLDIEIGLPKFKWNKEADQYSINVDDSVQLVRPHVAALIAKNGSLADGTILQLAGMRDDLQNGLGRGGVKAYIVTHNMDRIEFPVRYTTVNEEFSFVPFGQESSQTIRSVLERLNPAEKYDHILQGAKRYPILFDSNENVLALPPILNGNIMKLGAKDKNLFIVISGTNKRTVEDILAILAITLYDAGFELQNVSINGFDGNVYVPKLEVSHISIDLSYVNALLGLQFQTNEIIQYLKKSRLDAVKTENKKTIECCIPRYRIDVHNQIDIVEEVAIGYGIYNLEPTIPLTALIGQKDLTSSYVDIIRNTMVGLQMLEIVNFTLVSKKIQYDLPGVQKPDNVASVKDRKSSEHEVLRDMLLPSLLNSLAHNVHEEYPQKLFEIGKIFEWREKINEYWSLGAVVAESKADYTQAKSIIQTLLKLGFGKSASTEVTTHPIFASGRCANVIVDDVALGVVGEITPYVIENFKIRVPVAAFELNISKLLQGKR